jgi:hypothetical protein
MVPTPSPDFVATLLQGSIEPDGNRRDYDGMLDNGGRRQKGRKTGLFDTYSIGRVW